MANPALRMWQETAWHLAFLPSSSSSTSVSDSSSSWTAKQWIALLEELDGVGYDRVGRFLQTFEGDTSASDALTAALAAALQTQEVEKSAATSIASAKTWPQAFKAACAALPPSSSLSSSSSTASIHCGTVVAQLAKARSHTSSQAPSASESTSAGFCYHDTGILRDVFFEALSHHHTSASSIAESNITTFALASTSDGTASDPKTQAAFASFERVWRDARLYASLLCHQHHVCGRAASGCLDALARWLARYIHRHATSAAAAATLHYEAPFLGSAAASASSPASPASTSATPRASALRPEAIAAVYGVVAGIVEYALAAARTLPQYRAQLLQTWVRAVAGAESDVAVVTPCHVQEEEITTATAVLLSKLVTYCQMHDLEAQEHEKQPQQKGTAATTTTTTTASTAEPSSLAALCATHVVHCVQELLFTLVLGGGTRSLPVRPSPPPPPTSATTGHKSQAAVTRLVATWPPTASTPLVVTARALTLCEADSVAQLFFPALLQQLGFEWPWSALLRFVRQLGKHQRVPAPAAVDAPSLTVAWSSQTLMEAILTALARRTYPGRLHDLLPGSYATLLESLGLSPPKGPATSAEGEAGEGQGNGAGGGDPSTATSSPSVLFQLPLYYQAAGQALVEHFARCEGPGGRGVRAAETEQVLARVTASLPVMVQLRARIAAEPTASSKDNTAAASAARVGSASLSPLRAEALQCRYQAEVLLAAVVVHTQLETASHVQILMRALAPLFATLCTPIQQAGGGSFPMLVPASGGGGEGTGDATEMRNNSNSSSRSAKLVFTSEAAMLLDQVGYQFYPLEWLPSVAAYSHHHHQQQQRQQSTTGMATLGSEEWSTPLPYSLWAAVAHQLSVSLRLGEDSDSSVSTRASLACGERAPVVLPSFSSSASGSAVRGSLWEYVDGPVANAAVRQAQEQARMAQPGAAWKRAERFFVTLMDRATFLSSRLSSCDLEGTLAVAVTRRLGNNHSNVGGALSLMPPSTSPVVDRVRHFFGHSHVLEQLYQGVTTAEQAERSDGVVVDGSTTAERKKATKRPRDDAASTEEHAQLAKLLLREGAASFVDVFLEARDFPLALAGAFLPSTRVATVAMQSCLRAAPLRPLGVKQLQSTNTGSASDGSAQTLSQRLLLAGWKWSVEAAMGGAATSDRIRVLQTLEQEQQQQQQQPRSTTSAAMARAQWWTMLSTCFNSGTFDAVALSRLTLRRAVTRLVEKIGHRQHEQRLFHEAVRSLSKTTTTTATGDEEQEVHPVTEIDGGEAGPDPLLVHQWLEWQDLMPLLGLAQGGGGLVVPSDSQARVTASTWLWGSPFTSEANGW